MWKSCSRLLVISKMLKSTQIFLYFLMVYTLLTNAEFWNGNKLPPWDNSNFRSENILKEDDALFQNCGDSLDGCDFNINNKINNKRTFEHLPPILNLSRLNKLQHKSELSCACEKEFKWIDLGVNYFPRYLHNITCSAGGCLYSCNPKEFHQWVLRRRQENDMEVSTSPVPYELRANWIGEPIKVIVDCACAP